MSDFLDEQLKTSQLDAAALARLRAHHRDHSCAGGVSLMLYLRDGVRVVPLVSSRALVIGRLPPADVAVRDASLSRQHACVELIDGHVWIEDLGSTNGTCIDGKPVERSVVGEGAELTLGAVSCTVHRRQDDPGTVVVESHDRFHSGLEAEVLRARTYQRRVALLLVRGVGDEGRLSRWFTAVRDRLRPFDRVALYSADTLEILLPEADTAQGRALAADLIAGQGTLRCGLGVYPEHGGTVDELVEVTREAQRRASAQQPIREALAHVSPSDAAAGGEGPVIACDAMKRVYSTVERLASRVIPVLLQGETGTGKEVVARALHDGGERRDQPLICVNCGGIPSQLVESTLFGHEKGAFTGAGQRQHGVFESARGGSVLLDEVGELPAAAQAALLRVLENKRFSRVGSSQEIEVDVRVIAATHRDLESMCDAGSFRRDLLYRLNAMTLTVPPLRDRTEEIPLLVGHFVELANRANGCQVQGVDEDALQLLCRYRWPGNVRELRNAIERAVVIALDEEIGVDDLPGPIRALAPAATEDDPTGAEEPSQDGTLGNLRAEVERLEAEMILDALRHTSWDRKRAAASLGLPVRTMARKMKSYGLKRATHG